MMLQVSGDQYHPFVKKAFCLNGMLYSCHILKIISPLHLRQLAVNNEIHFRPQKDIF